MSKLILVFLGLSISFGPSLSHANCADWIDHVQNGERLYGKELTAERLRALSGERVTIFAKSVPAIQAVIISARRTDPRKMEKIYFRIYDLELRAIRRLEFYLQYKEFKSLRAYGVVPELAALDKSISKPALALNPTAGNLDVIGQELDLTKPATVAYIDLEEGRLRSLSGRVILPGPDARELAMRSGQPLMFEIETSAGRERFDQFGIVRVYGDKK